MNWKALAFLAALAFSTPAAATISSPQVSVTDAGNGSTTVFNFPFLIPYQSDGVTPAISVGILNNSTGALVPLVFGQFSVTGVGNVHGGSVTYTGGGTPLASGFSLVITRALAYIQPTAVPNTGFYPHTVETVADNLDAQIQQLAFEISQAGGDLSTLPLPVTKGGTGANNTVSARLNLNIGYIYSPLDYGTTCTDVTIQAAVNAAQAGGGGNVQLPVGICNVANQINISASSVGISCVGNGGIHTIAYTPTTCVLKWTGAAHGTILSIVAPSGSTANGNLDGNFVKNVNFDGNNGLAQAFLVLKSVLYGDFENIYAQSFNGAQALYVGNVHSTVGTFGDVCDSQFNFFKNININQYNGTSIGLYLDAWLNTGIPNGGCNASLNTFINIDIDYSTGQAIALVGADNNMFMNVRLFESGTGVNAIHFAVFTTAGLFYPSNSNTFYHLTANGPIYADGQVSDPGCTSYTTTFGLGSCTMGNRIYDLDKLNSTPDPTVEAGAQLIWFDTTGPTGGNLGGPTILGDCYTCIFGAVAAQSTSSLTVTNAASNHVRFTNGTDTWGLNIDGPTHNLRMNVVAGSGLSVEVPALTSGGSVTAATYARPGAVVFASIATIDPTPQVGDHLAITDASTCTANTQVTAGGGTTHSCPVVYNGVGWFAEVTH